MSARHELRTAPHDASGHDGVAHAPSSRAVRIASVQLDRSPGIPDAFAVQALSPGLNLVFGPNASGKSSLLRALDALLWPTLSASSDRSVRGRLTDGVRTWDVRLDGAALSVHTADGVRLDAPIWPAPALRHRLHLALHDLLSVSHDADAFAAAIVRASAGGLDLTQAGEAVGMAERAPRTLTERRALDDAERAVRTAHAQQSALHHERRDLDRRRAERDAARRAATQLSAVLHAQQWRAARQQLAEVEAARSALPPVLGRLRGHEQQLADDILSAWREAWARHETAHAQRVRADAARQAAFGETAPTAEQRERWRRGLDALRRADAACERARAVVLERCATRDAAAAALHPLSIEALAAIDQATVSSAAALATRLETALASATEASAHADVLREVRAETEPGREREPSRDTLRDAARLLTEWLAADAVCRAPHTAPNATWHWLLTAIAVAGWLMVAATWHVAAVLLALCTMAVSVWRRPIGNEREREEAAARCARAQRAFAALDVPAPRDWSADSVVAQLDVLARAIGDATVVAHQVEEGRRADALVARAQERMRAERAEAAELISRIGLAPGTDGRTLGWLLDRLARWQDAHAEVLRAEATQRAAEREHGEALARFTDVITSPGSLLDAEAAIAALEQRWESYTAAERDGAHAFETVERASADCARLAASWRELFAALALEAPALTATTAHVPAQAALAALAALIGQRAQWATLDSARTQALRDLARLEASASDTDTFAALCATSDAELEEQARALRARAESFEQCVLAVSSLEAQLQTAALSHDVQNALAHRDSCRDAVADAFTNTVGAVIAHVLVQHGHAETRDAQRPAVFHQARALFARITRGRWRLHVEDRDNAAHFRAEDTNTGVYHALDVLSAGTRVQLLVAVRVAFVASEETDGVQLPLFFDETLGTSDDERAEALIEAVLTLVREGRQVFYVTAQRDEVQKWHGALAESTEAGRVVPWRDIDLAMERQMVLPRAPARFPTPMPVRALPDSALQSHAAFGRAIGVAPVDPARTPAARWPLWYLTDDVPLLHAAWKLGISCWAELAVYREAGGGLPMPERSATDTTTVLDLLAHVALLSEELHRLSAIGHGRPVDRAALVQSGAVSPAFLEAVLAAAEQVHGDARRLVDALAGGEVARFGAAKVEALREALINGGWLDESVSLAGEAIRWGVIARSARQDAAELVDALLERLRQGAAPDPEPFHAAPPPPLMQDPG